jgi:hypothetical protein
MLQDFASDQTCARIIFWVALQDHGFVFPFLSFSFAATENIVGFDGNVRGNKGLECIYLAS